MKPLIGITSEFRPPALSALGLGAHFLLDAYTRGIRSAGGLPVALPIADASICEETMHRLDGLLLTGDVRDVPPAVLDEEPHPKSKPTSMDRWDSDVLWFRTARAVGTPVLAICFGMQLLNVAEGGTILQDIPGLWPGAGPHTTPELDLDHPVTIEDGSLLASMAPASSVSVRSTHHQAVAEAPPEYRVVARAEDGIIEAIEDPREAFILGVQWHPELAPTQPDWLLEAFIRHCTPGEPISENARVQSGGPPCSPSAHEADPVPHTTDVPNTSDPAPESFSRRRESKDIQATSNGQARESTAALIAPRPYRYNNPLL